MIMRVNIEIYNGTLRNITNDIEKLELDILLPFVRMKMHTNMF